MHSQHLNQEASKLWKAKCDMLNSAISQLKNYNEELTKRTDKINNDILKDEDISTMIDIMEHGLTKYEQLEVQFTKMLGPAAKIPLEQGPNDIRSENQWKEQVLQKIKTHCENLFTETRENNCKLRWMIRREN